MAGSSMRVVRASPGLVWRASDGDQPAGEVSAVLLPNDRWFVQFRDCRQDSYQPLLDAVLASTGSNLYATVDDTDADALAAHGRLGFEVARRESIVLIHTDPQVTGLGMTGVPDTGASGASTPHADAPGTDAPNGVTIISAAEADAGRLRLLDGALRQDVPGSQGWKWDPAAFLAETFSDDFDPATYLVAVDQASGGYLGLARVWNSPRQSRLGLVAVLPPYRRRGLARVLLARAFGVLHDRGTGSVTAEFDDTNTAIRTLLLALGATRQGGTAELLLTYRPGQSS